MIKPAQVHVFWVLLRFARYNFSVASNWLVY